ncbi:MAG: hypothetical protein AB1410_06820 [Acidobacteriota bacterium]
MDPLVLKKLAEEREESEKLNLKYLNEIESLINAEELKNLKYEIQKTLTKINQTIKKPAKVSDKIKKFFF